MAATPSGALSAEHRNRLAGMLLLGLGSVMLLISLFLDWFEPDLSAWTAFEVWDLVLAGLALMALVAVASRLQIGAHRPDSWLLIPALLAPVVVISQLLSHPPAAQGIDQDPMIGVWLALAGTLLMALGAIASVARISVALDRPGSHVAPSQAARPGAHAPAGQQPPGAAGMGTPPAGGTPGLGTPPAGGTPGLGTPPAGGTPGLGTPQTGAPGAATPPGEEPPTRPTRRILG